MNRRNFLVRAVQAVVALIAVVEVASPEIRWVKRREDQVYLGSNWRVLESVRDFQVYGTCIQFVPDLEI